MKYYELLNELIKKAENKNLEAEAIKRLFIGINFPSNQDYYLGKDRAMSTEAISKSRNASELYLEDEIPVQYILGYTHFLNHKIKLSNKVLIPRFETEEVVLKAIEIIETYFAGDIRIIDIGCGSGAIGIALKSKFKNSSIDAVDISKDALKITKENAGLNNLDIHVYKSNLLKKVKGKVDVIVSNPPYISKEEYVEGIVLKNEPKRALFAKQNGLYFYEKIMKQAKSKLNKEFAIIFEISYNKKALLEALARKYFPNSKIEFFKDINQNNRIMVIRES